MCAKPIRLTPICGVEGGAGDHIATDRRPWLAIEPVSVFAPGRWFRMRYRLGLYDLPARPIVSFRRNAEELGWHLLPGPVLGCGEWFAAMPRDATAVWISPVCEPGRFCFAIEEIEPLSGPALLRRGWAGGRGRLFGAIGTWLLGWQPEAEENLRWAIQGAPLAKWPSYRERHSVAARLDEFERPRCDWTHGPVARLFAVLEAPPQPYRIRATIASLLEQSYPRWTLTILGVPARPGANGWLTSSLADDPRISVRGETMDLDGDDSDFAGFIEMGDRLAPHALACFVELSQRMPEALVLYCDEEKASGDGFSPIFKPDWSAYLQGCKPYVGRLMLTKLGHARRRVLREPGAIRETLFAESILRGLGRRDVRRIPRFLVRTQPTLDTQQSKAQPRRPRPALAPDLSVAIVVASRDQGVFLRRTLAGILEKTRFPHLELIVVDNGTAEPRALKALDLAAKDPRVAVLRSPGAFNFAALNNLGAKHARARVIVFLNNDMDIVEPDWLRELAGWAIDPKVGAVGCKLLYPDGRIQHAGIVAGLGDGAGHFDSGFVDSGLGGEAEGWLGRNRAEHETSAVTGACLAVERAKFMSVEGFDAVHLPVEFGDIDLCLRLEERGFATMWTPHARLVHFESASRGKATFRRLAAHAAERAYFRERWADRLRDDPFFHPGLSLGRLSAALA